MPYRRGIAPASMGSTASALYLCVRNLVGGIGPLLVAWLIGVCGLQQAMLVVPAMYLGSGAVFLLVCGAVGGGGRTELLGGRWCQWVGEKGGSCSAGWLGATEGGCGCGIAALRCQDVVGEVVLEHRSGASCHPGLGALNKVCWARRRLLLGARFQVSCRTCCCF